MSRRRLHQVKYKELLGEGGGSGPPPPPLVSEYLHSGLGLPADYPGSDFFDGPPYTMGHPFCVQKAGNLTAVRFWKTEPDNVSSHQVAIYADGSGIPLVTKTTSGELAGPRWIEVVFDTPVPVVDAPALTQRFIAAVYRETGHYPATTGGPMTNGHYSTNSVMYSPSGTGGGEAATFWSAVNGNNTFRDGAPMGYPGNSFGAAYYWVDVKWEGYL